MKAFSKINKVYIIIKPNINWLLSFRSKVNMLICFTSKIKDKVAKLCFYVIWIKLEINLDMKNEGKWNKYWKNNYNKLNSFIERKKYIHCNFYVPGNLTLQIVFFRWRWRYFCIWEIYVKREKTKKNLLSQKRFLHVTGNNYPRWNLGEISEFFFRFS